MSSIKFCLVGETGVGKTYLTYKFLHNELPKTNLTSTIGVDYAVNTVRINKRLVRVQLWDTAGQERFRSITNSFYRNSRCVILVYDITDRESFNNLDNWRKDVQKFCSFVYLLGNKNDLESQRKVSYEEAEQYANKYNISYQECSKYDDIVNLFAHITAEAITFDLEGHKNSDKDIDISVDKKCCVIL
jgi:small GTP-binding protein